MLRVFFCNSANTSWWVTFPLFFTILCNLIVWEWVRIELPYLRNLKKEMCGRNYY
jgi:hypothetical protein